MAFRFNPHLFEGTGGAAAGAAATGAQAAAAQVSGANLHSAKSGDQGKPTVLYGKQPASTSENAGVENISDAGGEESKTSTKTTSNLKISFPRECRISLTSDLKSPDRWRNGCRSSLA